MVKTPAYKIVYRALKENIQNGTYPVGSLLPPEPELEKMFNVSRTTVRRAMSELVTEGHVHVRQGYGTEVLYSAPTTNYHNFHNITSIKEIYSDPNGKFSVRGLYIDRISANKEVADALAVNVDDTVFRMQRIVFLNETPFNFKTNYLRIDIIPDLDKYAGSFVDLYQFLRTHYDIKFESGKEYLFAGAADFIDAQLLNVSVGTPLLCTKRIARTEHDPLEFVQNKMRTDVMQLCISMEGPPLFSVELPKQQ